MKAVKPILALALVIAVLLAAWLLPVDAALGEFLTWIEDAGAWGPVVLTAAWVPASVFLLPGTLITLGAGFAFGLAIGVLSVSIGSALGAAVTFLLGRTLMRGWVASKLETRPRLAAIDEAVAQRGFRITLLIRLSPAFPYNLLGYVFGATRVSFRDHFFASWIGMLPATVLYVYIGCAGRHLTEAAAGRAPRQDLLQWFLWGAGFVATVIVTVLVTRIATRAVREALPDPAQASARASRSAAARR